MGQLRQVLRWRWPPTTTPHPGLQLRSTTPQPEQPYGALNPMFQLDF